MDLPQRFTDGEREGDGGQAHGVDLDVLRREGRRDPGREGHRGGQGRGFRAGQRPGGVGGDGRRTALGHVGEQPLGLEDAQGLAYGTALDAELVGQLGLGGHAVARPQCS
jgi:hypothetical protein